MSEAPPADGVPTVRALSVTPVKGTRIRSVESVLLERSGARGDRRFFVVEGDRMVNAKIRPELQSIVTDWDDDRRRLELRFPSGLVTGATVDGGVETTVRFFSRRARARLLDGPWSDAISSHLGAELRLAELIPTGEREAGVDRGHDGAVSLVSRGSLARLAREAVVERVDPRRFRMLVEVDGLEAHGEDAWARHGAAVRIGEAVVRFGGHVGRCLVTSLDPDTGAGGATLPTLDLLRDYRGGVDSTEPLPFGIYGRVLEPGVVRVGDPIVVLRSA